MNDLLKLAIDAHGGAERWKAVQAIDVSLSISGKLMEIKGYPEPLRTVATMEVDQQKTSMYPYGGSGYKGVFTPDKVSIKGEDGLTLLERADPRGAFAGHTRETRWDELHRLYFLGYAMWDYVCAPFIFADNDFETNEINEHYEDGEVWRVLAVKYPERVTAHCKEQKYYFDQSGILKRIDYVTDIAGGVASHYCYDPIVFDGIIFPTRRRVVPRTKKDGPKVSGPTAVFLDYDYVKVHGRPKQQSLER